MKDLLIRLLIVFFVLFMGCGKGQVHSISETSLSPVSASNVLIFRSLYPEWQYKEIGTVIVKDVFDISEIYDKMRSEAAKRGADAVVDFTLETREETIPVNSTSCVGDICTTTTTYQALFVHRATGIMVVKADQ